MMPERLAHYRIIRPIGAGGMGEVFLAEDTKLGRDVALKVLAPALAADPERRARFEREARAVAALNHPNIITIYSVEEQDGVLFMTMELIEGRTLAEVIPSRVSERPSPSPAGVAGCSSCAESAAHAAQCTSRS